MHVISLHGFTAIGISITTSNQDEMLLSSAKIPDLWSQFHSHALPLLNESSNVYGVYTNYDSDADGTFDVIACSDALTPSHLSGATTVAVSTGLYLVFSKQGEIPDVVQLLWRDVWAYFQAEGCSYARAYTTDFEFYQANSLVELYIAIVPN